MNQGTSTAPQLGLGIIGAGGFATFLAGATASLPAVSLRAVTDVRADAARRLAEAHGARAIPSWPELLDDDAVDIVVVATTPDSHRSLARAALEAGMHVFCEKPLALHHIEARDLVATVVRRRRVRRSRRAGRQREVPLWLR